MLCDTILAFPDTPMGRAMMTPEVRQGWREFGDRLRTAQRFVLQRDVVMMTLTVTHSTPKQLVTALGVCRLPFPRMWVEFAFKDRLDWLKAAETDGLAVVQRDDAPPPQHLGFYLEQMTPDGRDILVQPAWVHADGAASICHLAFRINTSPDYVPPPMKDSAEEMRARAEPGWTDKWIKKDDEIKAAFDLESRIEMSIPPWLMRLWGALASRCSSEKLDELYDLATYDLRSEWRFTIALLTLLNSRNIVQVGEEVDLTRLNKARKKSGKSPLLPHREIRLSLSKVQRNRLGIVGSGTRDIAAHIVRGHYKVRSGGIFWWNPHVRGIGQPTGKPYKVSS